ncbi:heat shock transcription factor, putative [Entamoeba histolytica HM-1:IMSS-B]|uniref:Heat shock transcription factor, putative n=8 Tax=Entamoeba TaxID=5758 RepID=C4M7L5_ENTH1|nr:heat shock transcription factor, putative [Entamoeba nuttalli P19]XP_655356.1 heat shock transcription factor, putative [Entamoeba histolytica HM-1:IMSS]EMD45971.1 heat shock transcription factor, putative [Entamoeba histolytica KU27]EMH72432.1 heat shock transcription factor, putative [Entamoeba histolytica HM-1:IMSS-B]EMS17354.1 heat shock transcription factor, putative [Entamoeba histolytica HM-3:IMSS]ENY60383.1 heat shock transcription factor, putative [Entamoeba histolytica HM-1:IMSS-A|eukprot:XP_008854746.1 heat shock transcription factor, putative [Entamoeba nuttalli P19]
MNVIRQNEQNDNTPTTFIVKLFELVNDEKSKDLICWSREQNRPGFVVLESVQLASTVIPRFFKHSNFSSFVRQLNIYGFHKVDHPLGQCFHHPFFKEGHPELLCKIRRQQPKRAEAENAEMYRSLLQRLEDLQKESVSTTNQLQQLNNMLFSLKLRIDEMEEQMQGMTECLYFINQDENRYGQQQKRNPPSTGITWN